MKKITIGIPTFEAGNSLVFTLQSIYAQTDFKNVGKIILVVDGNKISKDIFNKIIHKKLEIHYFKKRRGQAQRINDICNLSSSNFLILTNDDIILQETAVERIIEEYTRNKADLIAGTVVPFHSTTLFEKAMAISNFLNNIVASKWNKGDNYLSVNGRLIAVSKNLYKKIKLPQELWNNDAYFYIYTKVNNYIFGRANRAYAYYKQPSNMSDHLKQSKKFQNSYIENQKYFSLDISHFYKRPVKPELIAIISAFFENPTAFGYYFVTFIFTRLDNIMNKKVFHKWGFWPTDFSTKILKILS